MYKARVVLALGTWMALLPFLGLPYSWKDVLTTLTGLVLMGFSYLFYRHYRKSINKEKTFDNFRENKDFNNSDIESLEDKSSTPEFKEEQ